MSVRHALLALLSEGPKYGFQLRQEFEDGTGDVWPLNIGQVYSTLQRLEHSGHIESDDLADEGPQKVFRLTGEGKAELDRWLSTPTDMTSPPRDELVIKVLSALRVPGLDVNDLIQLHRHHLVELMQQWTHLKDEEADAELSRLDSVIRWLDQAEGRLMRAELEPAIPSTVPRLRRRLVARR
jgi:DNA-binding PadR family transcriptional regulator